MSRSTNRSDSGILGTVQRTAAGLHSAGLIDDETMRKLVQGHGVGGFSIENLMDERGIVNIGEMAGAFAMPEEQLAETAGLPPAMFEKGTGRDDPDAQRRLREMLEIIDFVQGWADGPVQAMTWYRAEPLPAFGGRTAEALVKSGQAAAVRDHLGHLATGGYA